ncbi:class I SAM-dependent methyltransferase [Conexibacter sp. S30A1]|uniref:class I SAM-dependent methyltransferase n=1 Tax=Conexibacter sp. S30A1 TaxID=2937800 RepID=UPI00200BA355|nr:class I SAM-dependent methyltransferase [Conexibacter sp. S30A1]
MSAPDRHTELDAQQEHWQRILAASPDRFGTDASVPARAAAQAFREVGATRLLELGAGQGRDTLFFATNGFLVTALDYAASATAATSARLAAHGLADRVRVLGHDLREPLPFTDASFDACYSHMLYCMAFTEAQLARLSAEILRVLRPGGLNVYTARSTSDPDWGKGTHHGENLYESGGFIVHFLSDEAIARLAEGYGLVSVEPFEEGPLPRRLVRVTMRKAE